MHLSLAGHPADAGKGLALQQDIEMALSPLPVTGMSLVTVAVIDHLQPLWRESLGELLMDHSSDWAGFGHVQFWKWKD
jgi:Flp pilus assembly protein TadB